MIQRLSTFVSCFFIPALVWSQSYTSYFTGSTIDIIRQPQGGVCLMGGASEHDEAMRWFLQRADGGDVLVLRASGADGYNDYMYADLGVSLNSVETIVFNQASAAYDPYVLQKIAQAEAVWLAGGDQWKYVTYWRSTPTDSLINLAIQQRNIVIGGTSAGMAVLGGYYFSAQNGTVTSQTALANPYHAGVTVDSNAFFQARFLSDVITDTHYDNPNRKGRHLAFLARIMTDYGVTAKGIACDEYTAVCIDEQGVARVIGDYPNADDNAYFIVPNCEIEANMPELCVEGMPLTWYANGQAFKVYRVKGTPGGDNSFDLNDWRTGTGGAWQDWSIEAGTLLQAGGVAPDCVSGLFDATEKQRPEVWPNPAFDLISINWPFVEQANALVYAITGQLIAGADLTGNPTTRLDCSAWPNGVYCLKIMHTKGEISIRVVKMP